GPSKSPLMSGARVLSFAISWPFCVWIVGVVGGGGPLVPGDAGCKQRLRRTTRRHCRQHVGWCCTASRVGHALSPVWSRERGRREARTAYARACKLRSTHLEQRTWLHVRRG